jgi:hypothetical protein
MKSVVATDSSNNFFVGWTLAGLMRCVFPCFKNDSFHIQIQHVVVFATKWLETLLLKLNGLKSQNISV